MKYDYSNKLTKKLKRFNDKHEISWRIISCYLKLASYSVSFTFNHDKTSSSYSREPILYVLLQFAYMYVCFCLFLFSSSMSLDIKWRDKGEWRPIPFIKWWLLFNTTPRGVVLKSSSWPPTTTSSCHISLLNKIDTNPQSLCLLYIILYWKPRVFYLSFWFFIWMSHPHVHIFVNAKIYLQKCLFTSLESWTFWKIYVLFRKSTELLHFNPPLFIFLLDQALNTIIECNPLSIFNSE